MTSIWRKILLLSFIWIDELMPSWSGTKTKLDVCSNLGSVLLTGRAALLRRWWETLVKVYKVYDEPLHKTFEVVLKSDLAALHYQN